MVYIGPKLRTTLIVAAVFIRVVLVGWGYYQDKFMAVKYTDIDYVVFTDAARFVYHGGSPYLRSTYRYSPLLAYLLVPNVIMSWWGKMLFCWFDLLCGGLIYEIVLMRFVKRKLEVMKKKKDLKKAEASVEKSDKEPEEDNEDEDKDKKISSVVDDKDDFENTAFLLAMIYMLFPVVLNISTRGNGDSIAVALVLLLLFFIERESYMWAAICYGLSIHYRIYTIIFVPALFIFTVKAKGWMKAFIMVVVTLFTIAALTLLFYYLYGFEFLFESLLYHAVRTDHRHNFSVFYYLQYLSLGMDGQSTFAKIAGFLPQLAILFTFGVRYANNLPWCFLLQTLAFVAFNKVYTAQYYIWYLFLIPVVLGEYFGMRSVFKDATKAKKSKLVVTVLASILWVVSQVFWLYYAYGLEFLGKHTFDEMFYSSIAIIIANWAILMVLMPKMRFSKKAKVE